MRFLNEGSTCLHRPFLIPPILRTKHNVRMIKASNLDHLPHSIHPSIHITLLLSSPLFACHLNYYEYLKPKLYQNLDPRVTSHHTTLSLHSFAFKISLNYSLSFISIAMTFHNLYLSIYIPYLTLPYLTLPYRSFILPPPSPAPFFPKRNELNEIKRANMWASFFGFLKERKKERKILTYLGGWVSGVPYTERVKVNRTILMTHPNPNLQTQIKINKAQLPSLKCAGHLSTLAAYSVAVSKLADSTRLYTKCHSSIA